MDISLRTNFEDPSLEFRDVRKSAGDLASILFVRSSGLVFESPFYFDWWSLDQFVAGLKEINSTLKGKAILQPISENSVLEFEMDSTGHVIVRGEILSYSSAEQKVNFEFRTDQTCLEPLSDELAELFKQSDYKSI